MRGIITWEPDPRHAELVIEQLRLQDAKPLKLPGVKEESKKTEKEIEEMEAEVAAVFRRTELEASRIGGCDEECGYVNSITDFEMNKDGWTSLGGNKWKKMFEQVARVPAIEVQGMSARVIKDANTGHIIDEAKNSGDTLMKRVNKKFKGRRNLEVIIEMDEDAVRPGDSWEEAEMSASDATRYRAIVARCNFLAIDRPDLMFAAKECSRKMARPQNGDWAALKRMGRYLIARPRVVHVSGGRASRTHSAPTVIQTGQAV